MKYNVSPKVVKQKLERELKKHGVEFLLTCDTFFIPDYSNENKICELEIIVRLSSTSIDHVLKTSIYGEKNIDEVERILKIAKNVKEIQIDTPVLQCL